MVAPAERNVKLTRTVFREPSEPTGSPDVHVPQPAMGTAQRATYNGVLPDPPAAVLAERAASRTEGGSGSCIRFNTTARRPLTGASSYSVDSAETRAP